jgi:NTP pyrophosphatase (non-canonical NTP hydrolase)
MMPPRAKIKINGEELEAEMVAEVLEQVTEDMAMERAEELLDVIADVTCLKAYLRSALYNKVFEFEAADVRLSEQVKRDMGRR